MWNPYGGPFDGIAHGIGLIVLGVFWLLALAVIVTILVLLVRFLLVATKAARLYVAKNSPVEVKATPAATTATTATTATAPTATTPTTTPAPTVVTPVVKKPRTPKAPPAV